jgi:hypothetical protein
MTKNFNLEDETILHKNICFGEYVMIPIQPLSSAAQSIVPGTVYKHYKELQYQIIGVARHSETYEELVVYQALYGEKRIWVRPVPMFLENVIVGGQSIPRFTPITN